MKSDIGTESQTRNKDLNFSDYRIEFSRYGWMNDFDFIIHKGDEVPKAGDYWVLGPAGVKAGSLEQQLSFENKHCTFSKYNCLLGSQNTQMVHNRRDAHLARVYRGSLYFDTKEEALRLKKMLEKVVEDCTKNFLSHTPDVKELHIPIIRLNLEPLASHYLVYITEEAYAFLFGR